MVQLCEEAMVRENASEVDYTYWESLDCVRICKKIRDNFEAEHKLVNRSMILHSTGIELIESASVLSLQDPEIFIPSFFRDGENLVLKLEDDVPISYLDITLADSALNNSELYRGPHIVGLFGTDILVDSLRLEWGIPGGYYQVLLQLRDVQVSPNFTSSLFN